MITFILPLAAFYLEPVSEITSTDIEKLNTHVVVEQIHQEEIKEKK